MTVKELKEKIKDLPDDMQVIIRKNDYDGLTGLLKSADVQFEELVLSDEF